MKLQTKLREIFDVYLSTPGMMYDVTQLYDGDIQTLRSAVYMAARTAKLNVEVRTVDGAVWVKNQDLPDDINGAKGFRGSYFEEKLNDDLQITKLAMGIFQPWDDDPNIHVKTALLNLFATLIENQQKRNDIILPG